MSSSPYFELTKEVVGESQAIVIRLFYGDCLVISAGIAITHDLKLEFVD